MLHALSDFIGGHPTWVPFVVATVGVGGRPMSVGRAIEVLITGVVAGFAAFFISWGSITQAVDNNAKKVNEVRDDFSTFKRVDYGPLKSVVGRMQVDMTSHWTYSDAREWQAVYRQDLGERMEGINESLKYLRGRVDELMFYVSDRSTSHEPGPK